MNNNEQIADIMKAYGFNHTKLADMLLTTSDTTRAWTCNPSSTRYRKASDPTMRLLQLVIRSRGYKPVNP